MNVAALEGAICDKPGWWEKIFDAAIIEKWRVEAAPLLAGMTDESPEVFDFALAELRWKASQWPGPSRVSAVEGVFAADGLLTEPQLSALLKGVAQLEQAQGLDPDWHPGSSETVRDLVHPSLFCFRGCVTPQVQGSVRSASHKEWERFIGGGKPQLWEPTPSFIGAGRSFPLPGEDGFQSSSARGLVWLPAEIDVDAEGNASFFSYINSLHPRQHPELYQVIAEAFSAVLPLLCDALTAGVMSNENVSSGGLRAVYSHVGSRSFPVYPADPDIHGRATIQLGNHHVKRDLNSMHSNCQTAAHGRCKEAVSAAAWASRQLVPYVCPTWKFKPDSNSVSADHFQSYEDQSAGVLCRPVTPPAASFSPPQQPAPKNCVDLRGRRLQVIVKMANIELTPAQPEYCGGSWHVEGMLDETIVASAIYYLDEKNVTTSQLAFRASVNDPIYAQNDFKSPGAIYGIESEEDDGFNPQVNTNQPRGAASTIPGRCLAWANTMQHCVQPFKLLDAKKPGHRKILCFFLVDPHRHIPSTATCPPQQAAWWAQELRAVPALFRLPHEVFQRIVAMSLQDGRAQDSPAASDVATGAPGTGEPSPDADPDAGNEVDSNSDSVDPTAVPAGFANWEPSWETDMLPIPAGVEVQYRGPYAAEWRRQPLVSTVSDFAPDAAVHIKIGGPYDEGRNISACVSDKMLAFPTECLHRKSDGPTGRFMSMADAKKAREQLMAERGRIGKTLDGAIFTRLCSLCEH
jgi:hypothetical protein